MFRRQPRSEPEFTQHTTYQPAQDQELHHNPYNSYRLQRVEDGWIHNTTSRGEVSFQSAAVSSTGLSKLEHREPASVVPFHQGYLSSYVVPQRSAAHYGGGDLRRKKRCEPTNDERKTRSTDHKEGEGPASHTPAQHLIRQDPNAIVLLVLTKGTSLSIIMDLREYFLILPSDTPP